MEITRTHTRLDGFRLHALHTGSGRPVVLLHGLCGSHRWWRYTIPALADSHELHVPEMIGFGGSRGADRQPSIPEMARLLARWMDALSVGEADFVGHSMGGQVAVHLAAGWPDRIRRLVLVNTAGIPHRLSPVKVAELAVELLWPRAWGRVGFLPTIAADTLRTGPRTVARAVRHILEDDIRPMLSTIDAPTLLVWGENDPLLPVEDARLMGSAIPDSRVVVIDDAAHNPMADRPEAFNRELRAFLDGGRA